MKTVILIVIFCVSIVTNAQIIKYGEPFSYSLNLSAPSTVFRLEKQDNNALEQKYALTKFDKSFRFGEEITVNLNVMKLAEQQRLNDGGMLYRYGIASKNAHSLSFIFSQFDLKKGSLMYIFDGAKSLFTGAYSFLNNNVEHALGTDILKSDNVIIEIYEPKENIGSSQLVLSTVVHGFMDLDGFAQKAFGGSGNCNYDVNCPLGSDFQDQKNGVAITISGGLACSGSLVHNTTGDIIPYYLTARHCGLSTATWVLRFNWERDVANTICAQTNSTANNGVTDHLITGTELKASSNISDFTLVKLNSLPDNTWNVFYNGWDNSDIQNSMNATVIHHPSQDIKKISKTILPPYKAGIDFNGNANCQTWRIDKWDKGTTEQGSSGSPLFDQNKRIIGVLTGGSASCSGTVPNNGYDMFGRFGYSWNTLADSALQLKCWLDPDNTGATYIDGVYQSNLPVLDLALKNPAWLSSYELCETPQPHLVIFNSGSITITSAKVKYAFNGNEQTVDWNGSLAQYQSDTLFFAFPELTDGSIVFNAEITEINGGQDDVLPNNFITKSFNYASGYEPLSIEFGYDFYTAEISWTLANKNDPSTIIDQRSYQSSGIFSPYHYKKCLPSGCYQLTINDAYGDGWSNAEYTNGYMVITNKDGDTLGELKAENANFGTSIMYEFCLDPLAVKETNALANIHVFPNPISDVLTIKSTSETPIEKVLIFDLQGKLIHEHTPTNTENTIILHPNLNAGTYLVKVETAVGNKVFKVVVL